MFPVSEDMDIERDGDKMFLVTTTTSAWGNKVQGNQEKLRSH